MESITEWAVTTLCVGAACCSVLGIGLYFLLPFLP